MAGELFFLFLTTLNKGGIKGGIFKANNYCYLRLKLAQKKVFINPEETNGGQPGSLRGSD